MIHIACNSHQCASNPWELSIDKYLCLHDEKLKYIICTKKVFKFIVSILICQPKGIFGSIFTFEAVLIGMLR